MTPYKRKCESCKELFEPRELYWLYSFCKPCFEKKWVFQPLPKKEELDATDSCDHEDMVSLDDGYSYCPDCNGSFKEGDY